MVMRAFTNLEFATIITAVVVAAMIAIQLRKKAKAAATDLARGLRVPHEFNKEGQYYVLEECRNGTSWWEICLLAEEENGGEITYTGIDRWPPFAVERQVEIEKIIGTPIQRP